MSNEVVACTNKLACMKSKLVKAGSAVALKTKQYSPEILTVLGVGGLIFATVKFMQAKPKAEKILDKHNNAIDSIDQAKGYDDYSERDAQQDTVLTYAKTSRDFAFLYGPIVMLGAGSIAAIFGAQRILRKRNVALAAAYKLVDTAFKEYRGRVIDELGEAKDFHFLHGTESKTVTIETVDEDGNVKKSRKKMQVLDGNPSMYARLYSEQVYDTNGGYTGSSQWGPNRDYNLVTLKHKLNWANEHLRARGYLFLNDVYDELGFPRTEAGQVVGWVYDGNGDSFVSFGPEFDMVLNRTPGYLAYQNKNEFLLDFNVDGTILGQDIFSK